MYQTYQTTANCNGYTLDRPGSGSVTIPKTAGLVFFNLTGAGGGGGGASDNFTGLATAAGGGGGASGASRFLILPAFVVPSNLKYTVQRGALGGAAGGGAGAHGSAGENVTTLKTYIGIDHSNNDANYLTRANTGGSGGGGTANSAGGTAGTGSAISGTTLAILGLYSTNSGQNGTAGSLGAAAVTNVTLAQNICSGGPGGSGSSTGGGVVCGGVVPNITSSSSFVSCGYSQVNKRLKNLNSPLNTAGAGGYGNDQVGGVAPHGCGGGGGGGGGAGGNGANGGPGFIYVGWV